jgi:peptide/nickel transport system substrate-binding protein
MTDRCRRHGALASFSLLLSLCLLPTGCGSPENPAPVAKTPPADSSASQAPPSEGAATQPAAAGPASTASTEQPAAEATPEPFNPPATLAELDKLVGQWEDRPVHDAQKLLSEDLAKHPPQVTVQEALAMKNNSPEDNAKILSALSQMSSEKQQPNWDSRITRFLLGDIKSPNPIMNDSIEEARVATVYNYSLFGADWNLVPFADSDVVVSWQSSKDRLYDKVVLRRDCTWSDGKPITAHDVEYSYKMIMNLKIPVPAVRSGPDKLKGVVAYDDYTVVFFHQQSLATNEWNIAFPIIAEHVYKPLYDKLEKVTFEELLQTPEYQETELHPVSGYAYALVSRTRNQELTFKRRNDWYMQNGKQVRAKPFFDEIRFRVIPDPNTALLALESGGLDDYEIHQEQWANQTNSPDFYDKNTKVFGVEWTYFYFGWNTNSDSAPFFKDRKVREAMAYAFDYKEMLNKLLFGLCEQCTGITHPAAWYAPKPPISPYQQDLDKAAKLLDEAGWVDSDGDGIRDKIIDGQRVKFEFDILVRDDPERVRWCELLKFNLDQIGVACNVKPMEATRLLGQLLKKEFQAECGGWSTGSDPDQDENVWTTHAIKDGRNFLQYSNPEVDKLFDDARHEFDRDKRAAIYGKIDEIISHDQPCTFLFWRDSFFGFNKKLRGYKFSPRGPFDYSPGFMSFWKAAD